jgi:hypothetical protein
MTRRTWTAGPWIAPLLFAVAPSLAAAQTPEPTSPKDVVAMAMTPPVHSSALLAEWDWHEFTRYWRKQFGKTSGIVSVVCVVAAAAVVIIISKTRTPGQV